jgi:hypothetical protein
MTMADEAKAPTAASSPADPSSTITKLSVQLKKLNDANGKYKSLLKMAKERIQKQEEELQGVKREKTLLEERVATEETEASNRIVLEEERSDDNLQIVQVCQRIKSKTKEGLEEIWALLEMEVLNEMESSSRKYKLWKQFNTESELQDFIRCDTGEPLTLPPYSLSPEQSSAIQQQAAAQISQVTEEFRRFRVRSELARKQADAQIRDLQSSNVQRVARRIETDSGHSANGGGEVERIRAEMATQEANWEEAYNLLLAENKALKSSGSEAMLAAQWRQRYETCAQEKEELASRFEQNLEHGEDKYEAKYRDLKESFRLYRKKAKEIFEEQNQNSAGGGVPKSFGAISNSSSADAKLSYLKNLMVNYFTSDHVMRDHMQSAIGTVLQFSPDDVQRIEKKKVESEAWF